MKQKTVRFSVIIPVYNTVNYLNRCLASIVEQEYTNYEIIIVDDGSTDGSYEQIEEYIKKYSDLDIVCIHQENKGLSAARNLGLYRAKGDYIIFVDSDDALEKNAMKFFEKHIETLPDIVIHRVASFEESTGKITPCAYEFKGCSSLNQDDAIKMIFGFKDFWSAAWSMIYRRDFLQKKEILFQEGIVHEDELWMPMVLSCAEKIECNPEVCYLNTANRPNSITSKKNIKKEFDRLKIIKELIGYVKKKNLEKMARKYIWHRVFILHYCIYADVENYAEEESYPKLRKEWKDSMKSTYKSYYIIVLIIFIIRKTMG